MLRGYFFRDRYVGVEQCHPVGGTAEPNGGRTNDIKSVNKILKQKKTLKQPPGLEWSLQGACVVMHSMVFSNN